MAEWCHWSTGEGKARFIRHTCVALNSKLILSGTSVNGKSGRRVPNKVDEDTKRWRDLILRKTAHGTRRRGPTMQQYVLQYVQVRTQVKTPTSPCKEVV